MSEGGREMALLHRLVGWKAVAQEKAGDVKRETSCSSFRLKKYIYIYKKLHLGTSMEVQWLRIPPQGTGVECLAWEEHPCCGATQPVYCSY